MGWIVYSKDGQAERCVLHKLEYSGTFMGDRSVIATFSSEKKIDFNVFDYITYRGERFELELLPTVKKVSNREYKYELRFVSLKYELERCMMRNIVPGDNGIVYPTPLTIEFTGDVKYLAERIQACLDAMYGKGTWSITIAEGTESEEKNISMSNQNCWGALSIVNTEYKLNYFIKGRNVTIGGEEPVVDNVFEYGKGKGLYEIERISDTDTGVVTKLRAYGGTKNLDYSYPKLPEWKDSVLPANYALSPLRLMLPSFKTDGKTDYVLASDDAIAKYGIREGVITYDDIYPSITGMKNSEGQAIDEIKSVSTITSDTQPTFTVGLYDLGFDLSDSLTTDEAQLSMKSGSLQGYTFNITKIEKASDGNYTLTLGRNTLEEGDTGNFTVPNKDWNMKAGDKFVLLNILMPQEYIRDAENRLLARAKEYLAKYSSTNYSYNVGVDEIFMARNVNFYNDIMEGKRLTVNDQEIGINNENIIIQSLTIKEGEGIIPTFEVTLNNETTASTLDRIQGQISEVETSVNNNFSSQSELLKQYRKKLDKSVWDSIFVIHKDDSENPERITSVQSLVGLWTDEFLSSKGLNPGSGGGSGEGGATALYQLNDVAKNASETGVLGAGPGKVLTYGTDGKWYAADAIGLDETALNKYLTDNNYAKKSDIPSLSGYATQAWVNTTLGSYATIASVNSALNNKVDKVSGMGLSQNNFTDALLQKLNGIAEGANKYILPVAQAAVLGGVMIGSTLTASATGVLNLPEVMTAGTYAKVTTDIYGRVTGGSSLSAGDIPSLSISKITGLQDALDKKIDKTEFVTEFDKAMQRWFVRDTANKGLHPADYNSEAVGIYSDSYVSSKGVNTGTGGGTGGASSLGELNNVGSWADEIPTVDRIMVQRKGATHWESLNLSDIGLNESQLSDYLTTNNYAKKSDIPSLTGYATESWVLGKGYITSAALTGYATQSWVNTQLGSYATSSALQAVSDKLNDFLTGTDTDNVINKWKELEAFLTGFKETDTLAGALGAKADNTITISAGTGLSGGGNLTANRTLSLKVATTTTLGGIMVGDRLSIDANGVLSATYTYTLPTASASVLGGVKVGTTLNMASSGVLDIKAVGTAGTYFKVTTNAYGQITSGSNPTTLSGFGITDGVNAVTVSGAGNAITSASISGHTITLTKGTTFLTKAEFDDLFDKVNIGTSAAPVYAIKAKYGLYTEQFLSSMGLNTGTGGGSGSDYDRLDAWTDYDASKAGWVLSAGLGNDLNTRMTSLEGGAAVTVNQSGTGTVVTGVTKAGTVITVTKGNLAFGSLTNKPTTLAGYGITDAVTLSTAQTISGQKTFSNTIRLSNKDIQRVNAATGTNATGSWWRTADYASTQAGIGCYTTDNASPRLFMGWGSQPWDLANNLTVSETSLTYKNNAILHAGNYNNYAPTKTGGGASGTWGISITGNAATATKLGTATVGGTAKGIYLNGGTPTAMSATVGSASLPVYMNAGTITVCSTTLGVSITGNAASATQLQTARTINGTSFNGTANITTANWGTARNIGIVNSDGTGTAVVTSVNGSAAVNLKLPATIKATLTGNASSATKLATARNITVGAQSRAFDGTSDITFTRSGMKTAYGDEVVYSTTPTAEGWYRIAYSPVDIGNLNGIFTLVASASGYHTVATIDASVSYGRTAGANITQLGCSQYNSAQIKAVRLVYHTTYTNNYAYLEIQMNAAVSTSIGVRMIGGTGWILYTAATAGSIPSGYTSKSLTLADNSLKAATFIGALTGNASTATKLATARTIFGKSFDGSANVAGQALVYGTYNATVSSRYTTGGLQIRENGLVGSTQTDDAYAPAIGFHWGNRTGASLIYTGNGFKFLSSAFTSYAPLYAGQITAQESYLRSVNNGNTIQIGSQNATYAHFSSSKPFWFNTGMEINGYCYPYTNNSFTLGNASKRWSSIYGTVGDFSSYIQIGSIRLTYDSTNNAIKVSKSDGTAAGLYAMGFLSSMGLATGTGGGGGGSDYDRLDNWSDYTADKAGYVLSAGLGNDLNTRLTSVSANYVTTNTPQTISAQKTWTVSQRMGNTSIHRVNSTSGANATGAHWYTANYAAVQFGIGVYTSANASPRGYIGWTSEPWNVSTNLTVSSTALTYKNNNILHAANYTDYAPTKTGTGASGTWGISISGGAAKLTTARTLWGQSFNGTANVSGALSGATTISASGTISTTNLDPGFKVLSGSASKTAVGWKSDVGAYIYNYDCTKYLGISTGGYPAFGLTSSADTMMPYTQKIFGKGDYEYYVVLLWKTSEQTYHRLTGKIFTAISSGISRYQAADVNLYHARWSSTGQDYSYVFNTYGQGEPWNLVTCTYGGEQYLALRHTNMQGTDAFFVGTFKSASFTAIKYYTVAHGSVAAVVNNSEINGSIADVTTSVLSANGTAYALTSSNVASATKLQTARTINGTSFDGTANITTAKWGTARTIGILNSDATGTAVAVSVDGSANVNLRLPATIKATLTGNATTATTLATARTLWGQSFNGSANVTGSLSSVGNITASAAINIISTGANSIALKYNGADATSVILNGTQFKPFDAANGTLALGSTSARWNGVYSTTGSFTGNVSVNSRLTILSDGKITPHSTSTRRSGVYGIYDSTKIGHIWSMGTAYQIPDDGANFGNLYGFAYKHTNNTTGGTMATGHQAVWCENGSPRVAMGTNFWVANAASVGGALSAKTINITSTEAVAHIHFARGGNNYITAPASGMILFTVNGQAVGDATSDLLIADGVIRPGANNATTNGSVSFRWSNTYTQLLNVAGAATFSSTVTSSGGFITGAANGFRITYGSYGSFIRSDGSSTYFLVTAKDDVNGSYNSLRPLYYSNSTGKVTMGNGAVISNGLTVGGTVTLSNAVTMSSTCTVSGVLTASSTLNVTGVLNANNTTDATSTTAAGAVFDGGVGIAKKLRVGDSLIMPYTGSTWISLANRTAIIQGNIHQTESNAHGLYRVVSYAGDTVAFGGLGNNVGFYGIYKATLSAGTNRTDWSTIWNTTSGKLTHNKDMDVSGILGVGGVLNANSTTDSTSTTTGSIVCDGGVGVVKQLRVGGATTLSSTLSVAGVATFSNTTDATSTTAAGVKVTGGLGVAKQLRVGTTSTFTGKTTHNGGIASTTMTLSSTGDTLIFTGGASRKIRFPGSSDNYWSHIEGLYSPVSNYGQDVLMNIQAGIGGVQIASTGGTLILVGQTEIYMRGVVHNSVGIYSDGYMSSKGLNDTSDMRLKNKVRDIFLSVKDIANAPAFEYTWKDGTPGVMVGSSAQYWQKVLSCSVREKKDGYLSMFYGHTAMVGLISLARHHENLEQRVARLEKEIKEKDKRILELERRISA